MHRHLIDYLQRLNSTTYIAVNTTYNHEGSTTNTAVKVIHSHAEGTTQIVVEVIHSHATAIPSTAPTITWN